MKIKTAIAPAIRLAVLPACRHRMVLLLFFFLPILASAQAVTGIITDFHGFWKTSRSSVNPAKPDNGHNLLAFTYNGIQYSTGVNDAALSSRGEVYVESDFWSLPVASLSSPVNASTKIGLGAIYDGVYNGPSNPAPQWGVTSYLTDGIKGLNIGTCVANLPVGTMSFDIQTILPGSIGDGVPDILVTQVADPTGNSYDRYEFTDANGARVGNYKDIIFNNITAIATWTADFYDVNQNPMTLSPGFTQTDRPIRLWAADLSELGITTANYTQIKHFVINLCGNSDLAFVAYNNKSVNFQVALPVQYNYFKGSMAAGKSNLNWQTASEFDALNYVVERSADGNAFREIGTVSAKNTVETSNYSFTDANPLSGSNYYRLKQVDKSGKFAYSTIVKLDREKNTGKLMRAFPNPASAGVILDHPIAGGNQTIAVYNQAGVLMKQIQPSRNAAQTKVDIRSFSPGVYYAVFQDGESRITEKFVKE